MGHKGELDSSRERYLHESVLETLRRLCGAGYLQPLAVFGILAYYYCALYTVKKQAFHETLLYFIINDLLMFLMSGF